MKKSMLLAWLSAFIMPTLLFPRSHQASAVFDKTRLHFLFV